MKIIDLLNKIANGEEVPKKIEYRGTKFLYDILNQCYIEENYNKYNDLLMELSGYKGTDLNYEVEIIEEDKKIEKCKNYNQFDDVDDYADYLRTKIDEIIDKINNINIIFLPSEIDINKCKKIDYLMENKQ